MTVGNAYQYGQFNLITTSSSSIKLYISQYFAKSDMLVLGKK